MWSSNTEGLPQTYRNPVYPGYFADPFVWKHEGIYYAVGTGREEAEGGTGEAKQGIFPLLVSRDLIHWEEKGHAMAKPEFGAAFGETFWAPEVACAEGRFYLYYSVGRGDQGHHLRVAVADLPTGPYHDTGIPLTTASDWLFSIDPHPFRDDDGRWYLFFAADFLDAGPPGPGSKRAGTALVAQALRGMTSLAGESRVVLRARHDWQRFQADRFMYGNRYDWHTLEGPCVVKREGRYFCLYSGGRWETEGYGVDFAVADKPLGPYVDTSDGIGPRVLRTAPGRMLGPGHNSLVEGPDGETLFIAYHAWDPGLTARRLCIDPLLWTPQGPRSPGPSWTPRPIRP
ncbi:MAG: glycoside hydrolase family 43 protein [Fibrobacteres bacterium]|jgi:beta-xylosidase|nr:glycoside hydrolase family 43 protein [Fibrobacterota bacterium]